MTKLEFLTFDEKLQAAWGLEKTANEHLKLRIDKLTAENERLREALQPFALIGDVTRDKLEDGLHSMPIKYYRIAADVMLEMIDD